MSTIIEELIVKLGLDSKDVESKTPPATKKLNELDKSAAGVEKSAKGASGELATLSSKLGAFLALLGGTVVLKTFIRDAIETNTQLSFLSRNLELSAQSISAWGTASEELGGTAQGLQGSLNMLSMEQTNLRLRGQSNLIPFFSMMRIGMLDVSGNTRKATDMLRDMAKWAQGVDRQQAHNIFAQMGLDEGTINLLLQGLPEINAALARTKGFAPDHPEKFVALKTALVDLGAQFTKIGFDLLESATPYLEKFFELLKSFGAWVQQHEEMAAAFTGIGVALGGVAAVAGVLGVALPALEAGLAALTGPIGLTAAAIGAMTAAILLLIDDYKTWAKGGLSLFDWTGFANFIHASAEQWHSLGDGIDYATEKFKKWMDAHPQIKSAVNSIGLTPNPGGLLKGFNFNSLSEAQRAKLADIASYAQSKGASPEAAIAIAQQAWSESGGNPQAIGDQGTSFGLFQIHSKNYKDEFRSLYGHGVKSGTLQEQIDFYMRLAKEKGIDLTKSGSAADFSRQLTNQIEKPVGGSETADARANLATALASLLSGKSFGKITGLQGIPDVSILSTGSQAATATNNRNITVGTINIHTQATDAKGIAASLGRGTDWLTFASQANSASQ